VQKFPKISRVNERSARAWTKRPRRQGTRTHAEAAERRRHVAEKIPAAGAAAVIRSRAGDIHAHPLAARLTQRIDALHGQAGQILHSFTSEAAEPSPSHSKHSLTAARRNWRRPVAAMRYAAIPRRRTLGPGIRNPGLETGDRAGTANLMARILPRTILGVKGKTPQDIVVRLHL
jgi:hypothetical protein